MDKTARIGESPSNLSEQESSPSPSGLAWRAATRRRIVTTDVAIVLITVVVARWLRFGTEPGLPDFDLSAYGTISVLLAVAWIAALAVTQSRTPSILGIGSEEYRRVASATVGVFGLLAIVSMLLKFDIARGYIAIALPLGLFGLLVSRRLWRRWLVRKRRNGLASDLALLVGHRSEVAFVAAQIERRPAAGYKIIGAVLDEAANVTSESSAVVTQTGSRIAVVGSLSQIVDTVNANHATAVIVAGNVGDRTFLKTLGWELEATSASLVLASRLTDIAGPRIHWRPIDGLPLMRVELPQYTGAKHATKRFIDIVLSGIGLVVFSPAFLVLAALIYKDDRGPIFFRQPRVGMNGQQFIMHKFRSMKVDADSMVNELSSLNEGNGQLFKIRKDPRVTRIGEVIRRYSLDELPQLWDVFRGVMSMVGPRPPLPREVATYEQHIHRRLNVRPGITGLWQVSGRSDLSWDESVRLDLYYVENWSPAGDALILFKTVRAVLAKEGAY